MNFLKGFVDGILAEDVESDVVPEGYYRHEFGDPQAEQDYGPKHADPHSRALDSVYRDARRDCIAALELRYGDGCVQQLNAVLKTNHEAVEKLTRQLEEAYQSLNDFNKELEALAQMNLALRRSNGDLNSQIELLNSENVGLKSVVAQAEIETKAQEARIAAMTELLKDNASTFNTMKARCETAAEHAAEVESLRTQLKIANASIEALTKERDSLLNKAPDPENRIQEAIARHDRAIAIAKMMAKEVAYLKAANAQKVQQREPDFEPNLYTESRKQVAELSINVDRLNDENVHLKEVNEKLHNMYADLSRSTKQLKDAYLMEAIESMGRMQHKQLAPLQVIFIQPTKVLDLELDMDFVERAAANSGYKAPARGVESPKPVALHPEISQKHIVPVEPATTPLPEVEVAQPQATTHPVPQPEPPTPSVSEPAIKPRWEDDFDIYDEILRDEESVKSTPRQPESYPPKQDTQTHTPSQDVLPDIVEQQAMLAESQQQQLPKTAGPPSILAAGIKVDLEKTKQAWNDDFDELLKEQ